MDDLEDLKQITDEIRRTMAELEQQLAKVNTSLPGFYALLSDVDRITAEFRQAISDSCKSAPPAPLSDVTLCLEENCPSALKHNNIPNSPSPPVPAQ